MSAVLDISRHQLKMDFNKSRNNGVEYVVLRCAYSTSKDRKFDTFIKSAQSAGLPVGIYHFATWQYASKSKNFEKAKANAILQANKVIEILKSYTIQKFVALDFELESGQKMFGSKNELTQLCNLYLDKIKEAGYSPVLYGSIANLEYWLDLNKISYPLWIAYYNSDGFKSKEFPSGKYGNMMTNRKDEILLWQYSSKGIGNSYGAGSRYIDLNHRYKEVEQRYIKESAPIKPNPPQDEKPTIKQKFISYFVKRGDNLSKIAKKFAVSLKNLIKSNPQIKNPNLIYIGNKIKVPTSGKSNPYKEPKRLITRGNVGKDVKWVQWELVRNGYNIGKGINNEAYGIDGHCGPNTTLAIKNFQRDHKDKYGRKLKVDGYVGPLTRWSLVNS